MRISALCTAVLTYVVVGHPPPAVAQVDQQRAQEYLREAQALCERDDARALTKAACPRHSFESMARNTGSRAPLPPISRRPWK
jgi:hypothetical protein